MIQTRKIPMSTDSIALGLLGADWLTDTNQRTGDWCIIEALADTVFASETLALNWAKDGTDPSATGTDLSTLSVSKGTRLYGRFSKIKLTSGAVVAYRASAY